MELGLGGNTNLKQILFERVEQGLEPLVCADLEQWRRVSSQIAHSNLGAYSSTKQQNGPQTEAQSSRLDTESRAGESAELSSNTLTIF